MGLHWKIIAGLLYVEIAVVLLLTLPVASPSKWNKLFKSQFLVYLNGQASMYFLILIGLLVLCLLGAIREIHICSNMDQSVHQHLDAKIHGNMRLFRAQRNFYVTGFALFLLVVIRRLVQMITQLATLFALSEANFRQAKSASLAASTFLEQHDIDTKKNKKEVEEFMNKISFLEKELNKERKVMEAIKSQAESLSKEYDRLAEEYSKLEMKFVASGDGKKHE